MAPGELQATEPPDETPFWNEASLCYALDFVEAQIQPPLDDDETVAMIGALNESRPPRHGVEEEIRYKMCIRAFEVDVFPVDERYVLLGAVHRLIKEHQDVIKKDFIALSLTVEA